MQVGSIEGACQKGLKARLPVFSEEVSQEEARQINGAPAQTTGYMKLQRDSVPDDHAYVQPPWPVLATCCICGFPAQPSVQVVM